MHAATPDWLDRDVIACLEQKCGTLVDAVLIAYASGTVGGELHSLGVRDLSTFGGADVYIPEGRERVVWARVVEYHDCVAQPEDEASAARPPAGPVSKDKGGRPPVEISKDALLEIFRQSLERARSTAKRPQPSYEAIADAVGVKRTWVTPIVKWAVKHQREARRAIASSETPARFSTFVRD